jgi:uncharacterized protein YkwD
VRAALFIVCLSSLPGGVAHAQPCSSDPALARAAEALLAAAEPPTSATLLEVVRSAGSDAPVVDALVIADGDPARRDRFVARVAARRRAPLACGEARLGERWLVLVAPRAGRLLLLPSGALRVELAEGWTAPRVFARDAEGVTWQDEVAGEVRLPPELVAPVDVQLVAEGPSGPRPVAELRVGEGAAVIVPDSDESLEARLAGLRERAGLGALRPNRLLASVAEAHAEEVCREGRVAHVSSDDADPRERLARAGLRARHVGEVIARVGDPADAYAALLRSPSHRAALTDPRFTDVGLARASAGGHACVVGLLAAWPRPVPY